MPDVCTCPQDPVRQASGSPPECGSAVCPICGLLVASHVGQELPQTVRLLGNASDPSSQEAVLETQTPESHGGSPPFIASVSRIMTAGRGRFTILRAHAQGGLGKVSVAQDEDLRRLVALKEIRPDWADDPQARQRFINEAEITGQLEHPGIVPIYALGVDAQGNPFYAMRFVQGRTLAEAIADYHRQPTPLGFRDLLRRFVNACQAVAYAHSRGIIHRDLTPANVMLGDFGETLVLDWGLAKKVGRGPWAVGPEEALPARSVSEGNADPAATRPGTAMGTPAYMSPEQAEGRIDQLGPATDVYALGVVLYQVLTGKLPFGGERKTALLQQVRQGSPRPPSEVRSGAPRALEAVCLKAMARESSQRYATGGELSRDVERWLADEPVTAYAEPLPARLGRWGRRHKPIVVGVGALLVTAVVALAVSTWLISREQQQTEAARKREATERSKADDNFREATLAKQRETAARGDAEENLRQAKQVVDEMLTEVGLTELAAVPAMTPTQRRLLEKALHFYEGLLDKRSNDPEVRRELARACVRVGDINQTLGQHAEAERFLARALALLVRLTEDFPDQLDYQLAVAETQSNLGWLLARTGQATKAEEFHRHALQLIEHLPGGATSSPNCKQLQASILQRLGMVLSDTDRAAEAERLFRRAIELAGELNAVSPDQPRFRVTLAEIYNEYGRLLQRNRRFQEAEAAYKKALKLREQLVKDAADPKNRRFPAAARSELARIHGNLAYLWATTGKVKEAEQAHQSSLQLIQQLVKDFPERPEYKASLANATNNYGIFLSYARRDNEALDVWRNAGALYKELAEAFPDVPDHQSQLGGVLNNQANAFLKRNDFSQARPLLEEAIRRQLSAVRANSPDSTYRMYLRTHYGLLIDLHDKAGSPHEAWPACRQTLEGWKKEDGSSPATQHLLGLVLSDLAAVLARRNKLAEAATAMAEAISCREAALKTDPGTAEHRTDLLESYWDLANFRTRLKQHVSAAGIAAKMPAAFSDLDAFSEKEWARILARCVLLAEKDGQLSDDERKKLAQSYTDRSMEFLHAAVKRGRIDSKCLKETRDLDPIRNRPEFQKLLSDLEAKAKAKPTQ